MLPFNPQPKPNHKRNTTKRKSRTNFSEETIQAIFKRDQYECVRCGSCHLESIPHHVKYRSAGGLGTKQNGITVCRDCHNYFHANKNKNNAWAVEWVRLNLDEQGDLKQDIPIMPGIKAAYY